MSVSYGSILGLDEPAAREESRPKGYRIRVRRLRWFWATLLGLCALSFGGGFWAARMG